MKVENAGAAFEGLDAIVLAVSGGIDSMVLLDLASRALANRSERVVVATFDHGTGTTATEACALVAERSAALGLTCVVGRADGALVGEAAFREARWAFLRDVARERHATIATAHTRDDQVETVLMRVMRGAGARGLAGLYAESSVVRPLLAFSRANVQAYARDRAVRWVDDPSNASREYFRNRVRHELLPALRQVDPQFDSALLAAARAAARWRLDVSARCDELPGIEASVGHVEVPAALFTVDAGQSARVLWPALAARAGAVLDWRGIDRLAAFTARGRVGSRIQLSGGWEVRRVRGAFVLARMSPEIL